MSEKNPVGRPAFEPTKDQRRKVSVAAGAGMRHEDIAIALNISTPTLRKYFEFELSVEANRRRLEVLQAMHRSAKKGSTAAARVYLQHEPKLAAPPVDADPSAASAPQLGKKDQANADARTAQQGTDWESLLKPTTALQ